MKCISYFEQAPFYDVQMKIFNVNKKVLILYGIFDDLWKAKRLA